MKFRIVFVYFYWNAMEYVPKRVENLYKEGHQLSLGQGTHFVMVLSNAVLLQNHRLLQPNSFDIFNYDFLSMGLLS